MTTHEQHSIAYIREEFPEFELPAYRGERYEALVPDTLDLQERAALSIIALTAPTDARADYELYWRVFFKHNPAMMQHDWSDQVQCKFLESLPLMRVMSGSMLNEHVGRRWMEVTLLMQGPDGLLYFPTKGRPWARFRDTWGSGDADHFGFPFYCGRMLGAMSLYYLRDGSEAWRTAVQRLVDGLAAKAIERGDYAYYSKDVFVPGQARPGDTTMPIGIWASALAGWVVQGLVQAYRAIAYEPAMELAGKLCRYLKDHCQYYGADGSFLPDRYDGLTGAHFHHHLYPQLGLIEYGLVTGDQEMLEFGYKGYEYGVANGEPLTGYFPERLGSPEVEHSEICEVADMMAMGLKLNEAGLGDHWDEIDRWTRNMFAEGQLTQCDWIARVPGAAYPDGLAPLSAIDETYQTTERVAERNLGAFAGWPTLNDWYSGVRAGIMHCCTGNGTRAIYYVWENILQHEGGRLRVNLLLNRASPWADVDSHVPYVGQVDVRVKQPVELSVRIPEWVKPEQVRVRVSGAEREVGWDGRYAEVGAVKPGDVATMTFPISERTDVVYVEGERYTLVRKGNDVVAIDPPGRYCPLYQREHYRANETRLRSIERFVSGENIYW